MVLSDNELKKMESTWKSDPSMARLESNWKTFEKWCDQLGDRKDAISAMLDHFGERAVTAPASSRTEFHNAFPGGLIDHSLRVLSTTINLAAALKVKVPKESLIISALFHDWGKAGTMDEEYYLSQDSDWHKKRGMMYTKNPEVKMPNAQLGLFTMSQFEIKLSQEEYTAILLNDGQYVPENKPYAMKEPKLALMIHMADRWSCQCEKGRESLLDADSPKF